MKDRTRSFEDIPTHQALAGSPSPRRGGGRRDDFYRQPSQWLPGVSLDDIDVMRRDPPTLLTESSLSRQAVSTGSKISPLTLSTTNTTSKRRKSRIFDDPFVTEGYASVPLLEMIKLPRGGGSIETQAVGRVQLGIPPETIKDSMRLGLDVPRVYIVPVERFCREMGPALGINLAEFEFPAYFNYFVRRKKCVLVVDSGEAEENIRSVFEETLLGPEQFRTPESPKDHEPEDFDPSYPLNARPDFSKEFRHFRTAEKTDEFKELSTDMLLEFCHFEMTNHKGLGKDEMDPNIGVPPVPPGFESEGSEDADLIDAEMKTLSASFSTFGTTSLPAGSASSRTTQFKSQTLQDMLEPSEKDPSSSHNAEPEEGQRRGSMASHESLISIGNFSAFDDDKQKESWLFSQVKWLGEVATVWPMSATEAQIRERSVPRAEIFKMPGGTEYIIHDVDENNIIVGKARFSGSVQVPDEIAVEGFGASEESQLAALESISPTETKLAALAGTFHPPSFGVTVLGNSHGFDKNGSTSGYVLWINGRGVMIDPPPYSSATLEREGIRPQMIIGVIITHCHADHDAGAFQKVLTGSRVSVITTPTIYKSFIRKYAALSGLSPTLLRHSHRHRAAIIGQPLRFQGATFHFTYTLHTIPCLAFKVEWRGRSMVFSGDHLNLPPLLDELEKTVGSIDLVMSTSLIVCR